LAQHKHAKASGMLMSDNIQGKVVVLDRLLPVLLMGVFRQRRPNHFAEP